MEGLLGEKQAGQIHARALDIKQRVVHLWANLLASQPGSAFAGSRGRTVDEQTLGEIQALPSYQDMFGNQNYCQCEACKSIFGPAAYYVDIMRITDRYVSTVNAAAIPAGYALAQRRPGLFSLPLSCATTNDLLPYLEIVDEILAERVCRESGESDVDFYLATTGYPFMVPDNQPLRRIRLILENLDLSLAALYATTSGMPSEDPQALARELLWLSLEQTAFVTTPLTDSGELQAAWGLREAGLDSLAWLSAFSRQSGLSRAEVTALTQQELTLAELRGRTRPPLLVQSKPGQRAVGADPSRQQRARYAGQPRPADPRCAQPLHPSQPLERHRFRRPWLRAGRPGDRHAGRRGLRTPGHARGVVQTLA